MFPVRPCPSALRGLGLLVSATLPLASLAAEPQTLQPVVVTATRMPQPIDTVLADLRVIDADTIANAGPMTLTELLQTRGGVEIAATGEPGQVSSIFLRGSNADHVVLLIDGVRVNSATAGTNAFENLPLAQIERIEILRGVGSSLYGADAIGGVIQVFTKQAGAERSEDQCGCGSLGHARGQRRPGPQARRHAAVAAGGLARVGFVLGHQREGQLLLRARQGRLPQQQPRPEPRP